MRDSVGDHGHTPSAKSDESVLTAFYEGMRDRAWEPGAMAKDAGIGAMLGAARTTVVLLEPKVMSPLVAKCIPVIAGATILGLGLERSAKEHTTAGKARVFGQTFFDVGIGYIGQNVMFGMVFPGQAVSGRTLLGESLSSMPKASQSMELKGLANDVANPNLLKEIRAGATGPIGAKGPIFGGRGISDLSIEAPLPTGPNWRATAANGRGVPEFLAKSPWRTDRGVMSMAAGPVKSVSNETVLDSILKPLGAH